MRNPNTNLPSLFFNIATIDLLQILPFSQESLFDTFLNELIGSNFLVKIVERKLQKRILNNSWREVQWKPCTAKNDLLSQQPDSLT